MLWPHQIASPPVAKLRIQLPSFGQNYCNDKGFMKELINWVIILDVEAGDGKAEALAQEADQRKEQLSGCGSPQERGCADTK